MAITMTRLGSATLKMFLGEHAALEKEPCISAGKDRVQIWTWLLMLHTCLGRSFVKRSLPAPNIVGGLSQVTVLTQDL